jgi:hypothetical protein
MLYVAFVKNRPRWQLGHGDLQAKSRRWWNEGGRPAGIQTLGFYGTLGTETPDVIIFEAASHEDIRRMLEYWNDLDFEVHPAIDLADAFRRQGMKIG